MLAHIVGLPLEESIPWLAPVAGLGAAAAAAAIRASLERHRLWPHGRGSRI